MTELIKNENNNKETNYRITKEDKLRNQYLINEYYKNMTKYLLAIMNQKTHIGRLNMV